VPGANAPTDELATLSDVTDEWIEMRLAALQGCKGDRSACRDSGGRSLG
jgi:hypothetical protein